tara:strand:+ start:269 stop:784 length:516 start_codon:yes stop_codon:yes gene_type:complete
MKKIKICIFLFVFSIFTNITFSEEKKIIIGKAIVTDGDSLKIGNERIRLFGIDAFELDQTCESKKFGKNNKCGKLAKLFLESLVQNRVIHCFYVERDRYKRILGTCFGEVDNNINEFWELNEMMVSSGNAVAYRKYSKKYIEIEEKAKSDGTGLSKYTHYIHPEEWRRKNK